MPEGKLDATSAPLGSVEALQPVWDGFRKGGVVLCPVDRAPLALAVDGPGGAYRFVCTACGLSSPWFEARFDHIALRGLSGPELGTSEE